MIIYNFTLGVGLLCSHTSFNQPQIVHLNPDDYTTFGQSCQQSKLENTLEFNYMTTEKLIQSNIEKYLNDLPKY